MHSPASSLLRTTIAFACAAGMWGCSPTVKIQAPDKPIEINLNVKIEQDVRVHIEQEVDDLARKKPGVF